MPSSKPPSGRSPANVTYLNPCLACSVREISVCGALERAELDSLSAIARPVEAKRRETIFLEGGSAQYLFNVTGGAVKIFKLALDGREQITGFLFPGDFLGLAHYDHYVYSAEAIVPTGLCRFPRGALEELCNKFPDFERRLLQNASNELAAAQDHMLLLGRRSANERVAAFLVTLSERAGRRGERGDVVAHPMSRGDIAGYLGLVPESFSRALSRLKRLGVIEVPSEREIAINDRRALLEIAGIDEGSPLSAEATSMQARR